MGRRTGCGKCHRDNKICSREPERNQDEDLTLPLWKELLKHSDAALTIRAGLGHAAVHWERGKKCHRDENECCEWRQYSRGKECDARLIAESGEVICVVNRHSFQLLWVNGPRNRQAVPVGGTVS